MAKIPEYHNEAAFPRDAVKQLGMNDARETVLPTQWGLTKREYMATALAAAMLSGAVARAVPGKEWQDIPVEALQLADKLLRELAK
jgi:hypothetical protein